MRCVRLAAPFMLVTLMMLGSAVPILGAIAQELPVPPIPPEHPPPAEIAPVPNLDAQAPVAPAPEGPRFDVRLFRARPYDPGMGFTPGSRYQTAEDRKPIQTPGLSVSVPLQ
jgi:hypothetical protein